MFVQWKLVEDSFDYPCLFVWSYTSKNCDEPLSRCALELARINIKFAVLRIEIGVCAKAKAAKISALHADISVYYSHDFAFGE